jgi:hypothetical protein
MLGKLVNGVFITPTENEFKKIVVTNPTVEQLKNIMGYKDVITEEQPPIADGKMLVATFEETDTTIIQHWEVQDIPMEEIFAESEV